MLEAFVRATLDKLAAGEAVPAVSLIVLVRVFGATGRADIADALGPALAAAAGATSDQEPAGDRANRLRLLSEASRVSDDRRLADAASAAATALEASWSYRSADAERASAVEAVLGACNVIDAQRFAPAAIEQLERIVAPVYEPGAALQDLSATVAVAAALLTAFDVSGRLAYPMLAEELMRAVRRDMASAPADVCSSAARVFQRLGALRADHGYRTAAVVAPEADYEADSQTALLAAGSRAATPAERAAYALALTECGEPS